MRKRFLFRSFCRQILFIIYLLFLSGCNKGPKILVSISGDKWYLNGKIINEGTPAEGLLMNVRMVNSVFEDTGDLMPEKFHDFNKDQNTENFISKIPEYMSQGLNAFTISLQGGNPGYEGAINSAFQPDGSLRSEYLERVERVIHEVDKNNGIVILTCFYQRQHSHSSALNGKKAIKIALENTANWIKTKQFRNVVLEVSNEYNHPGYLKWKDGNWEVKQ